MDEEEIKKIYEESLELNKEMSQLTLSDPNNRLQKCLDRMRFLSDKLSEYAIQNRPKENQ